MVELFEGIHKAQHGERATLLAQELYNEILIRKCEIIAQTNEDGTLSNIFNDGPNGCYASTFIVRRSNP